MLIIITIMISLLSQLQRKACTYYRGRFVRMSRIYMWVEEATNSAHARGKLPFDQFGQSL